ncbi:endophilin-A3a isoform X5 [Chiloscyllium plagiosum]|uniref:endophilin-A3a isoform X5 n=1 Tax=Chiloscyllium plagiosum TaxID=36176 RepID=UPI001CB843A6|nr:endophilin-A3a isoform X5 [Chiloscyllium plagiosum]
MSVAGLKKQFHKASQFVSEKMGGAEGTKLDEDFVEMERKIEATSKAVAEVLSKTTEYLQPNPAYRAKLGMLNTMSKIRGQVKTTGYPQPEGLLGECMLRNGKDLGDDSNFGPALVDVGEALKQMAEVKDSLDIDVKQNFIDPLQILQEKDLKEIGVEQISQLLALVDAALNYHKESTTILEELHNTLQHRITTASSRPKREFKPKPVVTLSLELCDNQPQNGLSYASSFKSSAKSSPFRFLRRSKHTFSPSSCTRVDQPFCKALYDFDPENEGELGFKEGDVIILTNQIDENWFEGMLDDESGFFPINYVQVIVPLPQ